MIWILNLFLSPIYIIYMNNFLSKKSKPNQRLCDFLLFLFFLQFLFLFFFPGLAASYPAYLCFFEWSTPEWPTDCSSSIAVDAISSNLFARIFEAAFTNYSIFEKSLTCVILVMIHLLSSVTFKMQTSFWWLYFTISLVAKGSFYIASTAASLNASQVMYLPI